MKCSHSHVSLKASVFFQSNQKNPIGVQTDFLFFSFLFHLVFFSFHPTTLSDPQSLNLSFCCSDKTDRFIRILQDLLNTFKINETTFPLDQLSYSFLHIHPSFSLSFFMQFLPSVSQLSFSNRTSSFALWPFMPSNWLCPLCCLCSGVISCTCLVCWPLFVNLTVSQ